MRRQAMTAALAMVLVASGCGGGPEKPADHGAAPSPTAAPATTTAPGPSPAPVKVYLVRGEVLEAVDRVGPKPPPIGADTLRLLLEGPTADEAAAGFGTAVPAGTRLLGLTIDAATGVARADLSGTFESGAGTLGLTLRLAQVTCTLDQFESVRGVRFALDGRTVDVFSGNGLVLAEPVSCASYAAVVGDGDYLAAFWPVATLAGARDLQRRADAGEEVWRRDPAAVARAFAQDFAGWRVDVGATELTDGVAGGRRARVTVNPHIGEPPNLQPVAGHAHTVEMVALAGAAQPVWLVQGLRSANLVVDTPADGQLVGPEVRLAGRGEAYEATIVVEVRDDRGTRVSRGPGFVTTANAYELSAFRGSIELGRPATAAGVVVLAGDSGAGPSPDMAAVRVRFRA
ncbi:MAG: GerMN domain-containing protein, partial [Acidimicrobiales bacterium]